MSNRELRVTVEVNRPITRLVRPFQEFASRETSGGILLFFATAAALIWANSPFSNSYFALWHTTLDLGFGGFTFSRDLRFWVNDALMAVFFLVVGLEIKRELLVGELASPRKAALPIIAATGGVLVPALIYSSLNAGTLTAAGWGIPMATDIAFVIGVMALLPHVPTGLKVFLTALAIVDDIAAVLVIAFFYTDAISRAALGAAGICFLSLIALNRLAVRHPLPYALLGLGLWCALLQSGVHATIAGVLLAMTIPSRAEVNADDFLLRSRSVLDVFERTAQREKTVMTDEAQRAAVETLGHSCEQMQPPLHRLEKALHPWVMFCIMPAFALGNAGVHFDRNALASIVEPSPLGIILGLLIGKPLGITLATWLAVRTRLGSLPAGVRWIQIHGAAWLGGIGFTMSLFLANLAFSHEALLNMAKLGIFTGSVLAGIVGSAILLRSSEKEMR